ncbi:iron complex outermembrane recepter protein [Muriicola jejuensis]|uniref:TonB-dependent receptor n=1 Tax=Muriicola jejuensis TaxID=504488 RepID=A0A6P0UH91_9FLAO|nr:TonB-dependent receptor [Muriicola jejuensis]NER11199.1 TonB-dependent receptor [Muriicola jejuensis]SMP24220.1 iron complex outermembrane recepter protein [Muriicola jejuensis]
MKNVYLLILIFVSGAFSVFAQKTVTGTVTDQEGIPLVGVNIVEKGTSKGTTSDFDGNFSITVADSATLVFSYIGYVTKEEAVAGRSSFVVVLSEGLQLDEIQLVGSRSPKRTATNTAVPVDVIDVAAVTTQSGRIEVNEMLQFAAPSFNANKQSGSDGADHIDPATLRGLGPDQTLVLINGKRRHQSSLINIFGTRGRGNTGTDLNAIPATAIKRIEILRDGASAQYGSDAIAGVINIVLKDNTDGVSGLISYGAYSTNADVDTRDFQADNYGVWNTDGFRLDTERDGNQIGEDQNFDGGSLKAAVNYGIGIGERGYVNFTTEYISKNKTLRPAFDFRKGFGEAAIDGFNFMVNAVVPLGDKADFYAFGGRNYRDTDAYAFTRNGGARVIPSIYPDGFTPRITSNITDNAITAGFRTELNNGWKADLSNTYGKNNFHYFIKGTLNASLEDVSPTDFDAGGHSLSMNTLNLDFSKYYDDVLSGMNLAFGAEYRTENFIIFAGEEGSWGTYDVNGLLITDPANQVQPTDPDSGDVRPGGSQGFPGYSPANEVDRSRSNLSLYADGEFDLSESFLLSAAARFENYSDFGSTLNGKLAMRLKATENVNLRGSISTGFRAPSLAQIYYNLRFTNFVGGQALESLLSPNNSPVTASFGIEQLTEEKAFNAGLGLTANFGHFSATVDGYYIDVKDRIVLTGNFDAPQIPNVEAAQFFANGADTRTIGLDVVLSWKKYFSDSNLSATFTGNINDMKIKDVKNGSLDEQTFFGERDKAFLLASAPASKLTLNVNYDKNWFDVGLAFTHFSKIELLDFQMFEDPADYGGFANQVIAATDTYDPKLVTDLVFGFDLDEDLKLNIGANNLFNVYPDQQDDWTEAGGYFDSVQMGFGGAFFYGRLTFSL